MTGSIKQFLYAIMAAITFSLLLVMGNTMAMTVRERTKEVGTLKAIGFKRHTIAGLFVGESVLLALVGAAIGIGGAVLLYRSFDMSVYIPGVITFVPITQTLIAAFHPGDSRRCHQRSLLNLPRYWSNNSGRATEH